MISSRQHHGLITAIFNLKHESMLGVKYNNTTSWKIDDWVKHTLDKSKDNHHVEDTTSNSSHQQTCDDDSKNHLHQRAGKIDSGDIGVKKFRN